MNRSSVQHDARRVGSLGAAGTIFSSAWTSAAIILAIILLGIGALWLWLAGCEGSVVINPHGIQASGGFAYRSEASTVHGGGLPDLFRSDFIARWPLVEAEDTSAVPEASQLQLREDGKALSPAHSMHNIIREQGNGAFSHWQGGIYFSASDNSDPRTNGRKYVVVDRAYLTPAVALPLVAVGGFVLLVVIRRFVRRHQHVAGWLYRRLGLRWAVHNILPGVGVTAVLLALLLGAGELYWRMVTPFPLPVWPSQSVPGVGFTFLPHATVRFTNYTDFWSEQRSNSLGFLDREPPASPQGPNVCRVVFVGDSFVEAVQVPIAAKFHVLFEKAFNAKSAARKVETVAFGFSGSGQIDQLGFYDKFVRPLKPDVIILVIVNNDLANNSGLLEAIRNGWHPLHSPRLFAFRDPVDGAIKFEPIDPKWQDHVLPVPPRRIGTLQRWHDRLFEHSYLYRWVFTLLSRKFPGFGPAVTGNPTYITKLKANVNYLRQDPRFRARLTDWPKGALENLDGVFNWPDPLAPVFQDAIDFSDFALAQWSERARRDGANLTAFATSTLIEGGPEYLERVEALLKKNGIEEISQVPYAAAHGFGNSDIRFANDGHWNRSGHQRVAEQMSEYFEQHPQLCKARWGQNDVTTAPHGPLERQAATPGAAASASTRSLLAVSRREH